MPLLYSISFLIGSFVGFGRAIKLYRLSRDKLYGNGKWEIFKIFMVLSLPSLILPFIFSVDVNMFYKLVITFFCFSVGFSWSNIISPAITEIEIKLNPVQFIFHIQNSSDERKSITKELIEPFINPFRNLYNLFTFRKYILKEYNCKLHTMDDFLAKKFQSLCYSAKINSVDLYTYDRSNNAGFAILKPLFRKGNHFVCLSTYWYERLTPKELTAIC
ncbi:MAG: hypothetical protein K0R57_3694 [Paenibacillaceae bacterium]|nr:hypothetical protein [Paenibacillaceae bacterium]